jgi:hypothetical protein
MDIATQKTVFCTLASDGSGYVELLTLDGISLVADSGNSFMIPGTRLVIDGTDYMMLRSGIEIVSGDNGASVTATMIVAKE